MTEVLRTFLIGTACIAGAGVLLFLIEEGVGRFLDWRDNRKTAAPMDDAGIDIVAVQGDFIPDLRKPHYSNGCDRPGCPDCAGPVVYATQPRYRRKPLPYRARWTPTDAEIEQFINDQTGGAQ